MALLSAERHMHISVPDLHGGFSKQEIKSPELEIRSKSFQSIISDMQKLSAKEAGEQDELTVGFSLPEMKIDGITLQATFGKGDDSKFKLTELRWNDESSPEGKSSSPTRVLEFSGKEPNYLVQKPSLEARYNRIALMDPPDPSHAFTEPKPAKMSLADLSVITDKVRRLRIQYEVDSGQKSSTEHQSAA